jgi:hypothetical protein
MTFYKKKQSNFVTVMTVDKTNKTQSVGTSQQQLDDLHKPSRLA